MNGQTVLFHTHGLGPFDFSAMDGESLTALNGLATARCALLCPTVYLGAGRLAAVEDMLRCYGRLRAGGRLDRLIGFAVEGPVLGANGGTPDGTVWRPTQAQWRRIAGWFALGLKYVVIAPDILALEDEVDAGFTFADLLDLIYASGGRVAIGHFDGASPELSARRFGEVLDHLERRHAPSPYLVLTDHLFNDMPRTFQHAFRTPDQRASRAVELAKHGPGAWRAASLAELVGPVPAAMLLAARERRLTPALNFDGGHVDLAICRMVVEFLGPDRVIAITDHTETLTLAGERLVRDEHTRLLYRADGVLAASSVTHEEQRANMQAMGLDAAAIELMLYATPLAALQYEPCRI